MKICRKRDRDTETQRGREGETETETETVRQRDREREMTEGHTEGKTSGPAEFLKKRKEEKGKMFSIYTNLYT